MKFNSSIKNEQKQLILSHGIGTPSDKFTLTFEIHLKNELTKHEIEEVILQLLKANQCLRTSINKTGNYVSFKFIEDVNIKDVLYSSDKISNYFTLEEKSLIRFSYDDTTNKLKLIAHHLILDGFSIGLLLNQLDNLCNGSSEIKNDIDRSYEKYLKEIAATKRLKKFGKFYRNYMDYVPPTFHESNGSNKYNNVSFTILKDRKAEIIQECKDKKILLSAYFLYNIATALGEDIIINYLKAGRENVEIIDKIGLFFNTIPVRVNKDTDLFKVNEAISQLSEDDTSLQYLMEFKECKHIFSSKFTISMYEYDTPKEYENIELSEVGENDHTPFGVKIYKFSDKIEVNITYDSIIFPDEIFSNIFYKLQQKLLFKNNLNTAEIINYFPTEKMSTSETNSEVKATKKSQYIGFIQNELGYKDFTPNSPLNELSSLDLIQLISKINEDLETNISISTLTMYKSLQEFEEKYNKPTILLSDTQLMMLQEIALNEKAKAKYILKYRLKGDYANAIMEAIPFLEHLKTAYGLEDNELKTLEVDIDSEITFIEKGIEYIKPLAYQIDGEYINLSFSHIHFDEHSIGVFLEIIKKITANVSIDFEEINRENYLNFINEKFNSRENEYFWRYYLYSLRNTYERANSEEKLKDSKTKETKICMHSLTKKLDSTSFYFNEMLAIYNALKHYNKNLRIGFVINDSINAELQNELSMMTRVVPIEFSGIPQNKYLQIYMELFDKVYFSNYLDVTALDFDAVINIHNYSELEDIDIEFTSSSEIHELEYEFLIDLHPRNDKITITCDEKNQAFFEELEKVYPAETNENLICEIAKEYYNLELKLDEDFISQGGDSLKAIFIVSETKRRGFTIDVKDLYSKKKIEEIAIVENIKNTNVESKFYKYSYMESLFASINKIEDVKFASIMHLNIKVECDIKNVLKKLLINYPVLRSKYDLENSEQVKYIEKDIESFITVANSTTAFNSDLLVNNFEKTDRLFECAIYISEETTEIKLMAQHSVTDAISWSNILSTLDSLLAGKEYELNSNYIPFMDKLYNENEVEFKLNSYNMDDYLEYHFPITIKDINKISEVTILDYIIKWIKTELQLQEFVFDVETHGRDVVNDVDVYGEVGWFTIPKQIHFDSTKEYDLVNILEKISTKKITEPLESPLFVYNYLADQSAASYQKFEVLEYKESDTRSFKMYSKIYFGVYKIDGILNVDLKIHKSLTYDVELFINDLKDVIR